MTYEKDPVIASLAARARDQVKAGLCELHAGNLLGAEVFLNAACATLQSLVVLLDGPAQKPMRKLALVGVVDVQVQDREPLPAWMDCKHGEDPDGAA